MLADCVSYMVFYVIGWVACKKGFVCETITGKPYVNNFIFIPYLFFAAGKDIAVVRLSVTCFSS